MDQSSQPSTFLPLVTPRECWGLARGWRFNERETEARSASEQLCCVPAMAVPPEPSIVIQAASPPGEEAAVPLPARQSQHSSPQRAGGRRGAHRDRERGPQSTHRASPEQGQGTVMSSSPQTRAVRSWRRVCPHHPGWAGWGLDPYLCWGCGWHWGRQEPSRAPVPWRCWCSAPGVTAVPPLAGQCLMWLPESPVTREMTLIQRLFPAQPGRALARLQARRCRACAWPVPCTARAVPRVQPGLGTGWIPANRAGPSLPGPAGDTAPLSAQTPRECFRRGW